MWGLGIVVGVAASIAAEFSDFDIRPRTGEYFQSTRAPFESSFGMRLFDVGYVWAWTVVVPVVLCPTGAAVAAVDKFALSPVWDVICLPYDAMKPRPRDEEP